MSIDKHLLELLVCPRHGTALREAGSRLLCAEGHEYPVIESVPVLLDDCRQTLWVGESSFEQAQRGGTRPGGDPYYLDTIGISEAERIALRGLIKEGGCSIDPVVSFLVAATNGLAYEHLIGTLREYPIPELRLPRSPGQVFLDIGCNWGRWCIAAARLGYSPIGIDPSLGAVLAAKRVAAQLRLNAAFVVGDARYLPFRAGSVDVVYSYSVLQHFSREDAAGAIKEIGRVLRPDGRSLVQMPTAAGLRCLYHQARRKFREARDFEVRYWSIPALRKLFTEYVGRTSFSVDCFFGIGLQASDAHLMTASLRAVIRASEALRRASRPLPWLSYIADSVFVDSRGARGR